jgi:hypothetical protein
MEPYQQLMTCKFCVVVPGGSIIQVNWDTSWTDEVDFTCKNFICEVGACCSTALINCSAFTDCWLLQAYLLQKSLLQLQVYLVNRLLGLFGYGCRKDIMDWSQYLCSPSKWPSVFPIRSVSLTFGFWMLPQKRRWRAEKQQ